MTIGQLPLQPRMMRELGSQPYVAPTPPQPDGDGFDSTLRAVAGGASAGEGARRFNENGFFAETDAVATPLLAIDAPSDQSVAFGTSPDMGILSPADLIAQSIAASLASPADAARVAGQRAGAIDVPMAPCAAPLSASISKATDDNAAGLPTPRSLSGGSTAETTAPVDLGRVRTAQCDAARMPITVTSATRDGAVAINVAAPGLGDREAEALRADIIDLLRRHGLVLDDLRLNGRAMGQPKDQSED